MRTIVGPQHYIVNVLYGTVRSNLMSILNMHYIIAKFAPRILAPKQKVCSVELYKDLCWLVLNDPIFISRIVTGNKTLDYGYDPEMK